MYIPFASCGLGAFSELKSCQKVASANTPIFTKMWIYKLKLAFTKQTASQTRTLHQKSAF